MWTKLQTPDIKHGEFSDEEDRLICSLFSNIGSRWSIMAAQLPGRTDNDIKNHWNTKLKKKMMTKISPSQNISFPFTISSILQSPPSNTSYSGGHGGGDGVLMFGSEGSSSSLDGGRTSWEEMGQMNYFSNGFEDKNGEGLEMPLEYGLEEGKREKRREGYFRVFEEHVLCM